MKNLCKAFYKLKTRKKGFTLVEMVIVIAIIGILAAILIPTFIGYIKSARHTSMINDTRIAVNAAKEAMIKLAASNTPLNAIHNIDGQKRGSITNFALYRAQRHNPAGGFDDKSYADYVIALAVLDALHSATSNDPRYAFNYSINPTQQTVEQFKKNSDYNSCGMIIIYNRDGSIYQVQFSYGNLFCEYKGGEYTVYEEGDPNAKFRSLSYTSAAK